MGTIRPLEPAALHRRCDPNQFSFSTTAEIEDLKEVIGQQRAVDAVRFGIGIRRDGYNLYALGPAGAGRHSVVRAFLEEQAAREATPDDWCYINNFDQPQKPQALRLPPGQGAVLRDDIERLVEELRSALPAAFETEDYRTRKQAIEEEIKERHEKAFEGIRGEAEAEGITLARTPMGLAFAPVRNGEVLSREEFEQLPESERRRIESEITELQQQLQAKMKQVPQLEREGREKLKALSREVTVLAVGHLIDEVRKKYASHAEVVSYLDALQQDVIENVEEFLGPPESPAAALMGISQPRSTKGSPFFRRYQVNLLVDHNDHHGAPVVYENNPSYQNLIGQVEHTAHLGALVTDFTLIRAGALHRATGGYLMVDARKVLLQPYAWEGLKRALRSRETRIESLAQMLGLVSTVTLEPQPIPLNVKVVLVGERLLYYLLCQFDPDFNALFKVAVDFQDQIDRSAENHQLYARLIGTLGRSEKLLPFDRGAVARVIEHSARLAGDAVKLSTHRMSLSDLPARVRLLGASGAARRGECRGR